MNRLLFILALLLLILPGCTHMGEFLQGVGYATNPHLYQYQYQPTTIRMNCYSNRIGNYTYTNCY